MEEIKSEKKEKVREGSIRYRITEEESGEFNVVFEDSAEKSLVIFCAADFLAASLTDGLKIQKKNAKTVAESKRIEALRSKAQAVSFGSKMIVDFIQPIYKQFIEEENKKNEENKA